MKGSLRERSPGVFELRIFLGTDIVTGKERYRSKTFRGSKRDAEVALARLVVTADEERIVGRKVTPDRVTLTALIREHLKSAASELAPGTMKSYESLLRRHIEPTIGKAAIDQIDTRTLERFYDHLATLNLSVSTTRTAHALIRAAYSTAIRWGWMKTSPAPTAKVPTLHRDDRDVPTGNQIAQAITAATELDEDFGVFVRLSAATGARRGELCALRWSQLDLDTGIVRITANLVVADGGMLLKDTKNRTKRAVPIDPTTTQALKDHRRRLLERSLAAGTPITDNGFVFSAHPDGSIPRRTEWPTKHWATIRTTLNLGNIRLHDLRHFQATTLIAAGVPVVNVSKRIGHRDTSTTLNVYTHALEHHDRESANIIARTIDT